jgi:hypothetical protein
VIRPIPPIPRFTTRSLIAAAITWSILVLVSILHIARYENTPGTASAQAATQINPLSQSRPPQDLHIELFIHPRCPCSAATLEQLATIDAARQPRRLIAWVYIPKDAPASWISGNTTTALRDTLHADIRLDVDGSHARSLGITTSGHILICDESGTPFFSGGITNSRGNPAPSQGAAAIHAWLNLGHGIPFTPVFGCGLLGDAHE